MSYRRVLSSAVSIIWLLLASFPATANEPCCDEAHGFHRSGLLYAGMPIDLDDGGKRPGRHGVVVAIDGATDLLHACAMRSALWVDGAKEPVTCSGLTKGHTLAVLDLKLAPVQSDSPGLSLPVLLSTKPFALRKATFAKATPEESDAVRAASTGVEDAEVARVPVAGGQSIFAVGTRHLPDGNGDQECATTAQAVFVRHQGRMHRIGDLPARPSDIAMADKPYLIVPVDCGKRLGIWTLGEKLEQVGYFDNGYEYGGT